MNDMEKGASKQVKKDLSGIEDQVQDILKSTELPDIGKMDLDETIRHRLEEADASELDSLEEELGITSDTEFYEMINEGKEDVFQKPVVVENQKNNQKNSGRAEIHEEDTEEETDKEASIDGSCAVKVNEDRMSAVIDLTPSEGNGEPLTYEMVDRELKSQGVVYGVNTELLKKLVQNVEKTKNLKKGVIIAQGTLLEQGKDGSIEFHFSDDESVLFEENNNKEDVVVT